MVVTDKGAAGKSKDNKSSDELPVAKKAKAARVKKNAALKTRSPDQLEKKINYHFKDQQKLISALTHASSQASRQASNLAAKKAEVSDQDNERLEFLGDRVLGLSISAALLKLYPQSDEGGLARRYNSLVRRKTCAEIAVDLSLGDYVILSAGEERSGGRKKSTILANAMEALLGAVFLDGGYKAADKVICKLWSDKLVSGQKVSLDAKTALQEWAQGQGFDLPTYQHINRTGPDHNPVFEAQVYVAGLQVDFETKEGGKPGSGFGTGVSKRIAEQNAARDLLIRVKVWEED